MRPLLYTEIDSLQPSWTRLAARVGGSLFSTYEWAEAWQATFGPSRGRLITLACSARDEEPSAIMALQVRRERGLRVARCIGHPYADWVGPLCAPEAREEVGSAIRVAVRGGRLPIDLLLCGPMCAAERWAGHMSGAVRARQPNLVARFGQGGWDDYLAGRSSNVREKVRRCERKLRTEHGAVFRLCDDAGKLDADFDSLLRLHRMRWGETSPAFAGPAEAFHRRFAHTALRNDWLRLWFVEIQGHPVAAWYGFRYSGAEWYYQAGRDPAWDETSVGFALLVHTIRAAATDGVREYRFLRGDAPFKRRLATDDLGLEAIAIGRRGPVETGVAVAGALRRYRGRISGTKQPVTASVVSGAAQGFGVATDGLWTRAPMAVR
jgi:CelD/BcsL family acetyltransferase involved in cellulose biosynthesis